MLQLFIVLAIIGAVIGGIFDSSKQKIKDANSTDDAIRERLKYARKKRIAYIIIGLIFILSCVIVAVYTHEPRNLYPLVIALPSLLTFSRKYDRPISEMTAKDVEDDNFVLYLRGFADDNYVKLGDQGFEQKGFSEIQLAKGIQEYYPLYAIGMTKEVYAPFGARRVYYEDSNWKEGVKDLIKRSRAIVILIHDSESCLFEIDECLDYAAKTYCIAYDLNVYESVKNKFANRDILLLPVNDNTQPFFFRLSNPLSSAANYDNTEKGGQTLAKQIMDDLNLSGGYGVKIENKTNSIITRFGCIMFIILFLTAILMQTCRGCSGNSYATSMNLQQNLFAISQDPSDSIEHYFKLADGYQKSKRHNLAIEVCKKILIVSPKNYKAYLYIGISQNALGCYPEAIDAYNKAMLYSKERDTWHSLIYVNRAIAYSNNHNYEESSNDIITRIEKGNELAKMLVIKWVNPKVYPTLREKLKKKIKEEPERLIWVFYLAKNYESQKEYTEAIKYYLICREKENIPLINSYIASCYRELGDKENATNFEEKASKQLFHNDKSKK